ncbi:MAG: hypothetical protein ACRDRX_19580 [Pseudonocardiaceae bacterium]
MGDLDVSTQAGLLEVIAEDVRDRAAGVLLITHDRLLAEHWCDRIVELPALGALAAGKER